MTPTVQDIVLLASERAKQGGIPKTTALIQLWEQHEKSHEEQRRLVTKNLKAALLAIASEDEG